MFVGPLFHRELSTAPRRGRFYVYCAAYPAALTVLVATAWLVLTGTQVIQSISDMARFGTILFQILALLQLAWIVFFAAMMTASSVGLEKDRRTLVLLLMTRLSNSELVLGKLCANLIHVGIMIVAAIPVFLLVTLFGGTSLAQVARVVGVTATSAFAAGSLGAVIGFWREKTFQTLALTMVTLVIWLGGWEAVFSEAVGSEWLGVATPTIASSVSPLRAMQLASRPLLPVDASLGPFQTPVHVYLCVSTLLGLVCCGLAIGFVRIWNPSRELRRQEKTTAPTIEGEQARAGHVDAQLRTQLKTNQRDIGSRPMWDNPVLWRELRTWAYGRKILFIRIAYLALVAMTVVGIYFSLADTESGPRVGLSGIVPAVAKPLVPLFFVSIVIVNALSVSAITTERDGLSLDLLLATDLSPKEFIFGKLIGVASVAGLMVLCPVLLTFYVWWRGEITTENTVYIVCGLLVMDFFVAMLGLHCGMRYASTRIAIGVSVGTVFFLFLGVVTCILMMISFTSFEGQFAPFLAFILGGSVGLYFALGARNPSKALNLASLGLPFLTFYAITSFLLGNNLAVFLAMAGTYGFTTAAMMVPALYEFDFAMGRAQAAE